MEVVTVESTDNPEIVACKAARGDYFDGFYPDVSFAELMAGVEYSEQDEELADEHHVYSEGIDKKIVGLLRKLLKRGHFGVWEHPTITFSIEGVSRVVMSQITRHRHLSFDVQSMRYVSFDDTDVVVPPALAGQSDFSRESGEVSIDKREHLEAAYTSFCNDAFDRYQQFVEMGVPKEAARYILPLGTPVNMTVSGNLRSWLHVLVLRNKADVQPETRRLAQAISDELHDWAPYTCALFEEAGPYRPSP